MRDTPYATELRPPGIIQWPSGAEGRIERLLIKKHGQVEIRFSWWKNGKLAPRPLDLSEDDLVRLFRDAIANGVFTENFMSQLRAL
jgi:hypothetical protein